MGRLVFAFLLSTALFTPAEAAKRVALVIGNSNYENVTDLTNPVNDANLMEQTLKLAGFEVIRKNDLDQRGMKLAMIEFGRTLKQGAEASMFYYAGHGIEVNGHNYLVPVDSNTQSKEEADINNVDVNTFLSLMENSGVPLNIVVLDACRNNPFRGLRSIGGGLAPVRAPSGTYVAYATAPGSVAADGTGENSPFTLALSESIKVPGLAIEGVFKQTRSKVRALTGGEQVPFDSSAIEGDFYFTEGKKPEEIQLAADLPADPPKADPPKVDPPKVETPEPPAVEKSDAPPVVRGDDGQQAFNAAGSDLDMLRIVAAEYSGTVWGKLAAARVKVLESQVAVAQPEPPKVEEPPAQTEPPKADNPPSVSQGGIKVASDGSGDYTNIVDAVAAAKSGDRIEMMPGTYEGGVVIDKSITIEGIGSFEQIIWKAKGVDVIQWKAAEGMIKNITLLQEGGCEKTCNAIYFSGGSAVIENNALTSKGGATLYVQGVNSSPTIIKNNIFGSKEAGIYLEQESGGTIELNQIYENEFAGIEVKSGSHPAIKNNHIRNGKQGGIFFNTDAKGTAENNDIYENGLAGIEVKGNADPLVRNNKVYNQKESGIFVNEKGRGTFEGNDIYGNGLSNFNVTAASNPLIRNNKIHEGKEGGVLIEKAAKATFENNEIYGNAFAGIEIKGGSSPTIRNNVIRDGKQGGLFIHEKGKGLIENNDITGNAYAGVEVKSGGDPVVKKNRINRNVFQAIYVYEKGRGTFTDNDVSGNEKGPFLIESTAGKIKRSGNTE
jgi:parallel beta-helix repeat protein